MRRRTGSTKSGTLQIKRSDEAPVTLQGWLYKQGHEGLMLWKKRWFVLSEFVLYYYKSPEEERTSGSILLPSYKISPVSKDNGISRKFAFKAEHKNMRTYYFAADSKDTMIQWMNAMSLASIGEQEQALSKVQRTPNDNNQSMMRLNSQVHNHPPVVHQMFSPNGNAYQYHPPKDNQLSPGGGIQPLYANAPPKPRRMNTSRDQSPSPERQIEEGMISPTNDPMMVTGRYHHPMTEVHQAHIIVDDVPPSYRMRPPQERRTPEAYGRMSRMQRNQIDYEDVYNRQNAMMMQQQQQQQPMFQQQQQQLAMHQSAVQLAQMRTGMSRQQMARPHSADFLEYDPPKMAPQTPTPSRSHHGRNHRAQPPRPKSSIEQRMLMDKQAFEETQMRSQSRASGMLEHHQHNHHGYVQPPPEPSQRFKYYPPIPSPHDSQLDLAGEEVSRYFPTPSPRKTVPQPPMQPPPQHPGDYENYQNVPSRRQSTGQFVGKRAESVTPMVAAASGLIDAEDVGEFKRSSSARLHRNKRNHPEMFNLDETKKREQREESMKRLLEWKQRMLQSPLTRKSSRNASRTQTPTNSDSPIPTMLQMENGAKPKQLEVNKVMNNGRPQPPTSQSSSEGQSKRISRKGSTASRSSRSRSSPRISNRPDISSSDEGKPRCLLGWCVCSSITIFALILVRLFHSVWHILYCTLSLDVPGTRQSRKRSKSQQSRGSRGSRSNSMSKLNSTDQPQPEYINISSLEEAMGRNQSDLSVMNHPNDLVVAKREWNRKAIGPDAWYNDDFNFDKAQHSFADDPLLKQQYGQLLDMRYQVHPPQFYDNGQLDQATVQICHESEMEHKSVRQLAQSKQRSNTWHGDKFAEELQIFERKNDKPVLLKVKKELDQSQKPVPKRSLDSSKESWSPAKVIDEIRKVKEAPPKNVVQDRRKQFESTKSSDDELLNVSELSNALEEAQKEAEGRQKKHSKIVSDFALSDSKESSDGMSKGDASDDTEPGTSQYEKTLQKKKSVSELLSDFEKKTQQLQEEEKKSGSGTRRRVFSDTETMMYDTSSDENDSTFDATPVSPDDKKLDATRKSSLPTILPSNHLSEVQISEGQYMPMVLKKESSPAETYLQMTPTMMKKETSMTSITSSNSSMHVKQQTGSVDEQGRRPSQSVVMEHLIQEFGPERAAAIMESFTDEPAPVQPSTTTQQPVESPRYQEIQEQKSEQMAAGGHYEYLFKATSDAKTGTVPPSPPQANYEVVYHEIPEEVQQKKPIKSPEMLPDILGNAPAGRGNSSSEADDEGGSKERSLFEVSDTFTPASFFLEKKKAQPQQPSASRDHIGSVNSLSSRELPQTPSSNNDDHASRRSFSYHEQQQPEQAYNPRRASNSSSTASPFKNAPPNTFLRQGQDINLTYQSVYENDDPGFTSSSSTDQLNQNQQQQKSSSVPYYVADIKRPESIVPTSTQEPIKVLKRRAQTPDSFLLEQSNHQAGQSQGPIMNEDGVVRSRSLEGLLGDGPAGPRDSVQVKLNYTQVVPPSPSLRSTPLPARGRDPPPPPEGVPPLDISTYRPQRRHFDDGTADDDTWRESLRRASARVKQSPEHTLPPPKLIPPNPTGTNPVSPHINGYVWDQREQRFYRLNVDPNPNPRLFHQQPFLDQGLPTHTNSEDAARIKQLQSLQRPKSVGPIGQNGPTDSSTSMMGRPNSTLPTSANQGHPTFFHAPSNTAPAQRTLGW